MIIRKAKISDAEAIANLDVICFDDPWSKEAYKKELSENPFAVYIVCEKDNQIIGSAGLWCIADEGHITNVSVHPDFRNLKVAGKMLDKLIEKTGEIGILSYTLEVRVSNEAAINLYEGRGFKSEGIRPNYYENNGEDAMIMWRR